MRHMNAGNALFLILIAVALFGALSYAITQSGRGGGSIDREQRSLQAAQIVQYMASVQSAVMRLTMTGCSDTQISFENNVISGYNNTAPDAVADGSCSVFSPNGGGLFYQFPDISAFDTSLSGQPNYGEITFTAIDCVRGVGQECQGSGTNADFKDVMMIYPYVTFDLCMEVNRNLDVPKYSGLPPKVSADVHTGYKFQGGYSTLAWTYNWGIGGVAGREFDGVMTACIEGGAGGGTDQSGQYYIYSILLAR